MYAVDSPTTREGGPGAVQNHRSPERAQRRRKRRAGSRTPWLLALPTVVVLIALLGYPLYRMIVLSFQNMRLRELLSGLTPPWVGFDQYTRVLSDPTFWSVT